jgi:hypothetical protein
MCFPENLMSRNGIAEVVSLILLSSISGASRRAWAQEAKTQYGTIAPLHQYSIVDRNAEIELARSAAPTSISRDATVLVFKKIFTVPVFHCSDGTPAAHQASD